ncbi:MAG: general secretion pathway protein GspK [Pirellulales bacterium]|nr:general secretion pathway protein GspK [Pirellulales bacterium]
MVLVLVLVVIAMLTLACFTFSKLMLVERRASRLSARRAQARCLAESGLEMARMFVINDEEVQDENGGWYDNEAWFRGVAVVDDEVGLDPGRFTIVAPQLVDGVADGIRFGLEDESTRLNLNTLLTADQATENGGRQILMGLPGMTEEIADAILDWIDEDDDIREFGAEVDFYSTLSSPYEPKNGPLETVEELLLVRGVTPWLLFGADVNRNGFLDANETGAQSIDGVDNSDGSMNGGWASYLTLSSAERNLNPDGEAKIDLNQDDMEELYSQLEAAIGAEYATFIVAYRLGSDATGESDNTVEGTVELDLTQQAGRRIDQVIDLIGKNVQVTLQDETEVVLKTPFPDMPGLMNVYLPVLMDHVAVVTSEVIRGRININQAPRTVMAGIPGLSDEVLSRVLSERVPNPADREPYQRHETWILCDGIVTLEEMKALVPFVTGGGHVYRAQIIGYYDRGGASVRIEAVFDATKVPTQLLSYRDLSHLGRGYSLETLGIEAPDWQ